MIISTSRQPRLPSRLPQWQLLCLLCFTLTNPGATLSEDIGNDFYLGFFDMFLAGSPSIVLVSNDPQLVSYSISAPGVRYRHSGTVPGNGRVVVHLPVNIIATPSDVQNKGIYLRINSRRVNVIGQSIGVLGSPTDTYTAIPIRNLSDTEYVYYGVQVADYSSRVGMILVVGTADNTVMKLTVPATGVNISNVDGNNDILTPGKQYTFVINRLETIIVGSSKDFTGTKIITNKQVSVFTGHECVQIPPSIIDCDHLIEQVPPTTLWGRVYYTTPLATRRSYIISVLAAYNSTNIDIYCNDTRKSYVLNEGTHINKLLKIQEYCVVFSDRQVLVVLFSLGFVDDNDRNQNGDPMMILLPSIDHYTNAFSSSTIQNPRKKGYNHFVNIIVLAQYYQPDMIYLISGGVNKSLDTQEWVPVKVNNVIKAYATNVTVPEGVVEIIHANPSALITIMVYGFAKHVGYGHSGGLSDEVTDYFTVYPKSITAEIYTSVTFQCSTNQHGNIQIQWKKFVSSKLPQSATIVTTKSHIGVTSTLKINKIIHHYKGDYYCVVKNESGEVNSSMVQLHVDVPCPEIIDAPVNATIIPGEVAKFDCLAYSHSPLQYYWKRKGSTSFLSNPNTTNCICGQDDEETYSINNTQPSDEGWYCCVVTNECGDVEECAWLEVDTTPVIVTHPRSVVSKEGGRRVLLHCLAHDYGVGHIRYKWEKYQQSDNSWMRPSNRARSITSKFNRLIFSVITEEDEGVYHCVATNNDGSVVSRNVTVTVYGPPTIVHITDDTVVFEGNKTALMCNVTNDEDAVNPVTIVWYNSKGENVKSNDKHILVYSTTDPVTGQVQSVLCFDPVSHTDSGEYTCHAFNDKHCYSEAATNLTVKSLPIIVKHPLSNACKRDGTSCELECLATGIGLIRYKWEKYQSSSNSWIRPSHRAVDITSPTLIFSVITEEDEGAYRCVVTNHNGSVVSSIAIVTVYGPPVINFIVTNTVTFEGTKVNLICNATNDVDAINTLSIDWYNSEGIKLESKDRHILVYNATDPVTGQVQSMLLFDPVNHTDSGEYTCHAFNDVDCYTEDKTNLTVEYSPIVSISPPSPHIIDVGDFLLLLCNAKGLPIPSVQWYKGNDAIGDLSEKIYYVPTSTPHTTVYTCVSRNKAGGKFHSVKTNITVIVQPPPLPCPLIAHPENGLVFFLNDRQSALFYCNGCHDIQGPPFLICIDGRWNLPSPKCVKVC